MIWENCILAENALAVETDWVRVGTYIFRNSLFIRETRNFGSPNEGDNFASVMSCSQIFPGVPRSYVNRGGLNLGLVQMSDGFMHMENSLFINALPNCHENTNYLYGYFGAMLGWITYTQKAVRALPPNRRLQNLYFVNTTMPKSFGHNATELLQLSGDHLYLGGFKDVNGSLPCSTAGSYWMHNTANVTTDDCEYRSNYNMWVCPPFNGNYRTVGFTFHRGGLLENFAGQVYADWECGKRLWSEPDWGYSPLSQNR